MRVVKVRRHGDDGLSHGLTQVGLGIALQLHQSTGTDFLGRILLAINIFAAPGCTHMALDRAEGAIRVRDGLALGYFADQDFACFGESHDRRGRA